MRNIRKRCFSFAIISTLVKHLPYLDDVITVFVKHDRYGDAERNAAIADVPNGIFRYEQKVEVKKAGELMEIPAIGESSFMPHNLHHALILTKSMKGCGSLLETSVPGDLVDWDSRPTQARWFLRQLIYTDGSFGETFLEVKLRHPGTNNRNVTRMHNWSVYVNPVGVDAGVKFFQARCGAAGYRWNPFLIHLAFPTDRDYYDRECTPEFPLRCDVGDLSGRLGPIDIGDKRYVFVDRNLPLTGPHGIMNKAIIIHTENAGVDRFACANIEPDDDIIKWVIIRKTPKFSVVRFMSELREVLGAPEWYLAADLQTVSYSSDQKCVTFVIHFMGPSAARLELDFSRLLAGAILDNPTISIRGVYSDPKRPKKVPYRTCGGLEEDDIVGKKSDDSWWNVLTGKNTGGYKKESSATTNSLSLVLAVLAAIIVAVYQ
ncbi:uncharacterized protein [Palaemon carinicauda]|uniref:uncharacterized protein n=1 Tax=Palaemon carinicauda TaxID=392227 RepID=UPI0035B58D36